MCFSANASFGAGAALLAAGVLSVRFIRKPEQIPFAVIPLIFGIQQICEGFLWLSLMNTEYQSWQNGSTYAFLVFAQIVWPAWVPFSIFLIEKNNLRKKILLGLSMIGGSVSIYLAYCIFNFPLLASISSHHIHYELKFPLHQVYLSGILYFIPTVLPAFFSSVKSMRFFGVCILISYVITKIFFGENLVSVWCYFAAVLSVIVLLIMKNIQKDRAV
jgi:hypothetical protein